ILARQHYENIIKFLDDGPFQDVRVVLLSSSLKKAEREQLLAQIAAGEAQLVVGTHALITGDVVFKTLSFVVIDEQHKFGVRQRALLSEKGRNPDVLIMTATPIPRTLCITLYGDLDVSIINEIPPGRGKVETLPFSHEEADKAYDLVRRRILEGRQAYVVYPIIEESETLDLKAAQEMFRKFKTTLFKDKRVALVHGKMKPAESEAIMRDFKAGKIDLLVATTVLEVGVDVANATVMVIEHADRFGLAQMHQLRGRIGRGEHDGLCLLVTDPKTQDGQKRIQAICSTTDGFKIAQHDLEIRGPGKYFGRHQHGLNELKVANPATQLDILELARKEAQTLTKADPLLTKSQHRDIRRVISRRYPTYLAMVAAG
ncbi:MAG: DEAD/DEAH box helicase, partial [Candidatus Omnitrophica bacterium]|nr:DEAD/DEAH box helicase [Candidatus Omnitrophota bacterium]